MTPFRYAANWFWLAACIATPSRVRLKNSHSITAISSATSMMTSDSSVTATPAISVVWPLQGVW